MSSRCKHTTEFRPTAGVRSRPKSSWSTRARGASHTRPAGSVPAARVMNPQTAGFLATLSKLAYTRMKQS